MEKRTWASIRDGFTSEKCIGYGAQGAVFIEDDGKSVSKVFHAFGPYAWFDGMDAAIREYDRMALLSEGLKDVDGVRCPQPIKLDESYAPILYMERCPGVPLTDFLLASRVNSDELDWILNCLARGLAKYVEIVDEPYFDFSFRNTFYDSAERSLWFTDFGLRDELELQERLPPYEYSVGNFMGHGTYELVRPAHIGSGNKESMIHVMEHLPRAVIMTGAVQRLDTEAIVRFATRTYRLLGYQARWKRQLWYRSIPRVMISWNLLRLRRSWHQQLDMKR